MPDVWTDLGERLIGSGSGDGHRAHDDSTGLDLDPHVVEARSVLRSQLVGWTRVVLEESHFNYAPQDEPGRIADWLRRRLDWIEDQLWCPDMVEEITGTIRHARALVQPNNVYRIELGPCPVRIGEDSEPCPGVVIAVMRKATAREQLPSVVACTEHGDDPEAPHAWGPMQWHALGRSMGRSIHTSAAEAFMRAVVG